MDKLQQIRNTVWTDKQDFIYKLNPAAQDIAEQLLEEQPHLSVNSVIMRAIEAVRDSVVIDRI